MEVRSEENAIELKRCPRCDQSLPISEFGICRARKDGRNLYCKRCIRQKIAQSRQALREYKNARSKYGLDLPTRRGTGHGGKLSPAPGVLRKLTPAERVREAIRNGARTQKEIALQTKLAKDEIGDALANLLLWACEIRTEVINHTRMYFINESADEAVQSDRAGRSKSKRWKAKRDQSFSSLSELMPGKQTGTYGPRRGGWSAN
jgi:hypothetical protein